MEAKTIKGGKAWLAHLVKAPIPILKASAKLLTMQIKAGASLADMTHTIERDPALCLHLFLMANKRNQNKDVEILSLSHVITVLGMQGVVNCVKHATQINLHKSDAYQKAYLQSQSNSLFAGHLMHHWVDANHVGSAEKLKWATILACAPMWLMWREAYGQMRKWQWLVEKDYQKSKSVEQHLFGCQLDDLYRMLGRKLGLPNMAQQALERAERPSVMQWAKIAHKRHLDFFDADSELKHLKSKPATLMSLLIYLGHQVPLGLMGRKSLRAQGMLANLTGLNVDDVVRQNHQLALQSSKNIRNSNLILPAVSLLWPQQAGNAAPVLRQPMPCMQSEMERDIKMVKQANASTLTRLAEIPPRQANKNLLLDLINQFKKQADSFKDIHEILLACNKAIHDGLGMRRTFICILNKNAEVLRPLYCVGIEDNSLVRSLSIKLSHNRFFEKLLTRSASFKVDRHNYEQVSNMLNDDVVKILGNKNFMVMSLFASGKAIGVVYTDASAQEAGISDKEYQAFKTICQSASYALDSYANKRKRKAG